MLLWERPNRGSARGQKLVKDAEGVLLGWVEGSREVEQLDGDLCFWEAPTGRLPCLKGIVSLVRNVSIPPTVYPERHDYLLNNNILSRGHRLKKGQGVVEVGPGIRLYLQNGASVGWNPGYIRVSYDQPGFINCEFPVIEFIFGTEMSVCCIFRF